MIAVWPDRLKFIFAMFKQNSPITQKFFFPIIRDTETHKKFSSCKLTEVSYGKAVVMTGG